MTSHPSDRPVSALRARMIEDMRVLGFSEKTRNDYIRNVRAFAAFVGRSPDTATAEDLRRFQHHQAQTGVRPPSINSAVAALRFLFTVTLDRPDLARRLTIVREPRRLSAVLSVEEVTLLLQAAPGPKYKAAFATAYGAGLRVSEVVALKAGDVDSKRMLLRVEQGKGRKDRKDRHAMLSPQLLEILVTALTKQASERCERSVGRVRLSHLGQPDCLPRLPTNAIQNRYGIDWPGCLTGRMFPRCRVAIYIYRGKSCNTRPDTITRLCRRCRHRPATRHRLLLKLAARQRRLPCWPPLRALQAAG
jgi:integrase